MSLATSVAARWVYGVLTGDATLMAMGSPPLSSGVRVYPDAVPQEGVLPVGGFPAIIFAPLPATPFGVVGGFDLYSSIVLLIVAADRTGGRGWDHLTPLANRIDTLLNRASGSPSGGVVAMCTKDRSFGEFQRTEVLPNGQHEHRLGRHWSLEVIPA